MDLIKFFSVTQSMASLIRYSQTKMAAPESVLQHSGFVALASYFIALEINSRAKSYTEEIPVGELLARAIVHDLDEVAVGDIARPTKYHSQKTLAMFDELKDIGIRKVVKDLHLEYGISERVLADHKFAKEGRIGLIVDISDKLAVVYKLWDECLMRHNYTVIKHAVHLQDKSFLPELRNNIKQLQFNTEQSFCLHGYLSHMTEMLGLVASKQEDVHGIVSEALG